MSHVTEYGADVSATPIGAQLPAAAGETSKSAFRTPEPAVGRVRADRDGGAGDGCAGARGGQRARREGRVENPRVARLGRVGVTRRVGRPHLEGVRAVGERGGDGERGRAGRPAGPVEVALERGGGLRGGEREVGRRVAVRVGRLDRDRCVRRADDLVDDDVARDDGRVADVVGRGRAQRLRPVGDGARVPADAVRGSRVRGADRRERPAVGDLEQHRGDAGSTGIGCSRGDRVDARVEHGAGARSGEGGGRPGRVGSQSEAAVRRVGGEVVCGDRLRAGSRGARAPACSRASTARSRRRPSPCGRSRSRPPGR